MSDEELVRRAEAIVEDLKEDRRLKGGRTQLSRAIDAAVSAGAPCVFKNWLAYQAKRTASRDFWQARGTKTMYQWVRETLAEFENAVAGRDEGGDYGQRVMTSLIRFLGFLRRSVVASVGEEEVD
jgi:hypothetical protein